MRDAEIFGNNEIDGEEKQFREMTEGGIAIELATPFRAYSQREEFSLLRIRVHDEKVFEVRWDSIGRFRVNTFEPGDWERTLRAWPALIPFE